MARPARAREVGDMLLSREVVEAVSAACSARRRESWVWANRVGFMGVGWDMVNCGVVVCGTEFALFNQGIVNGVLKYHPCNSRHMIYSLMGS